MKGLAVNQIILLALGVVVLALVGYLLYSSYISGAGSIGVEEARTSLVNACNDCKLRLGSGWDTSNTNPAVTPNCASSRLSKAGIGVLVCQLSIGAAGVTPTHPFGGVTVTCSSPPTVTGTPTNFAPSACPKVGVS